MKLLLDTCSFIWLCSDPAQLSARARRLLADTGNERAVSDATVWEIMLKWSRRLMKPPQPPRYWVEEQVALHQLATVRIERMDLYAAADLPPLHADPFDRLLVAQALNHRLTLVTPDAIVRQYPVPVLW